MRRNNALAGQLVGKWMRMRATCSITFAPILRSRPLIVANSARARGSHFGMADRTASISQNAAVCAAQGVLDWRSRTGGAVGSKLSFVELDQILHLPPLAV